MSKRINWEKLNRKDRVHPKLVPPSKALQMAVDRANMPIDNKGLHAITTSRWPDHGRIPNHPHVKKERITLPRVSIQHKEDKP